MFGSRSGASAVPATRSSPRPGGLLTGTVKSYNAKGFGFILSADVEHDVYFSRESLQQGLRTANIAGTVVSFELARGPGGKPLARNLRPVHGIPPGFFNASGGRGSSCGFAAGRGRGLGGIPLSSLGASSPAVSTFGGEPRRSWSPHAGSRAIAGLKKQEGKKTSSSDSNSSSRQERRKCSGASTASKSRSRGKSRRRRKRQQQQPRDGSQVSDSSGDPSARGGAAMKRERKRRRSAADSSGQSDSSSSSSSPSRIGSSAARRGVSSTAAAAEQQQQQARGGSAAATLENVAAEVGPVGGIEEAKREALLKLQGLQSLEPKEARMREWRALLRAWHPDKNPEKVEVATAVFQFLQKGKLLLDLK